MTEPKPMDPERLQQTRESLHEVWYQAGHVPRSRVVELLADRDYHATMSEERKKWCAVYCEDGSRLTKERDKALARAEAAEAERDAARRAVCERAAYGRPGHESDGDYETPADAARDFGWPNLYPEVDDG